jgi:phage terminase small subunit
LRRAFDEEGQLLPPAQWDDAFAASVASIEVVTRTLPGQADDELDAQPHGGALARKRNAKVEYIHKIKVWDKNSALEKIAKHLGMFTERFELTGKDGKDLVPEHSPTDVAKALLVLLGGEQKPAK